MSVRTIWSAIARAVRGRPVTHEEQQAAQRSLARDPMVDARGGAFTVGLGVLPTLAIIPHANTWSHEKIHRTVELVPKGITLAAVPEATALIRGTDGAWSVAGVGQVDVWVEGRPATLADLPA